MTCRPSYIGCNARFPKQSSRSPARSICILDCSNCARNASSKRKARRWQRKVQVSRAIKRVWALSDAARLFFFFQAEDGIRDDLVTGFRRVLFRSAAIWELELMATLTRRAYAELYGPTKGDLVRLADTSLLAEIEHDYTTYGHELL